MKQKGLVIHEHFGKLEDPRREQGKRHQLIDIITITICAVICGADDWMEVETYGRAKRQWLKTFLELPQGIPSHDTFARVFAALKPNKLQNCFLSWITAIVQLTKGEIVSIDGKALRRSYDKGKGMIHMVSAWATESQLVLGQRKVDEKSNEIKAIPELLEILELQGCIVTIDAMGCQQEIAEKIIAEEADYVLALKGNQGNLHEAVKLLFRHGEQNKYRLTEHDYYRTIEKNHGRIEERQYWTIGNVQPLIEVTGKPLWQGLRTIGMVRSKRTEKGETSQEDRYYLSSLGNNAKEFARAVRSHWGIENSVHWVLDISFREDESRMRKDHSAENFSTIRRIALNLLKQEQTAKCGVKARRLKAGWDQDYLLSVLSG
jgi:predicted transposase YbfD/YdcC